MAADLNTLICVSMMACEKSLTHSSNTLQATWGEHTQYAGKISAETRQPQRAQHEQCGNTLRASCGTATYSSYDQPQPTISCRTSSNSTTGAAPHIICSHYAKNHAIENRDCWPLLAQPLLPPCAFCGLVHCLRWKMRHFRRRPR